MSSSPIIEVRELSFRIGDSMILRDVSFTVARGDYISIIGPNGAGKSTLVKCLNRILRPCAGEIRIDGVEVAALSQRELARQVSYVPQFRQKAFGFTVEEFVAMGRYAYWRPFTAHTETDREAVGRALGQTHTDHLAERTVSTLSGGELQKVHIAAALAQEAPIMLLDEPSTFLDPRYQNEVNRLLRRLNREGGVTIISVSHDINSAVLNSDRVVALKNGTVAACGTVAETMTPETLRNIFDTTFIFVEHPLAKVPVVLPEHDL